MRCHNLQIIVAPLGATGSDGRLCCACLGRQNVPGRRTRDDYAYGMCGRHKKRTPLSFSEPTALHHNLFQVIISFFLEPRSTSVVFHLQLNCYITRGQLPHLLPLPTTSVTGQKRAGLRSD